MTASKAKRIEQLERGALGLRRGSGQREQTLARLALFLATHPEIETKAELQAAVRRTRREEDDR